MLGCLLFDEMKLSEALSFQRSNLNVKGFVDIGKYSTENAQGQYQETSLKR